MTAIKVCGVRSIEDAEAAVELGVDAIGLNLWPGSSRFVELYQAARVAEAIGVRARVVVVVVDPSRNTFEEIRAVLPEAWIQLHGNESDSVLRALLPRAYRVARNEAQARAALGDELLIDADVAGVPGGSGVRADWELAARLASERRVWLAGGLHPGNVAEAIARVRPFGVDVASGIERSPGVKDRGLIEAFVRAVRSAGQS